MSQFNDQNEQTLTQIVHPKGENMDAGGTMFDPTLLAAAGILPGSHTDLKGNAFVKRLRNRKFWRSVLGYGSLAIVSFFFFLYLTFPYAVIKEGLVGFASDSVQQMDARINIGSLRPYWFTGLALENVTVTNIRDSSAQIRFSQVRARLNILPLLIGRISASIYVAQSGGAMEISAVLPISGLVSGSPALKPSEIVFRKFPIDSLVSQALAVVKSSTNPAMALALPLVSVTTAGGMLNGKITFEATDLNVMDTLKGKIDLNIVDMYFHVNDNVLKIPKQAFTQARLEASIDKGAVVLRDTTAFNAEDMEVGLGGRVGVNAQGMAEANLDVKLVLRGRVEQNFGTLIPMLLKCTQPLKEKTLEAGRKESLLIAKLVGPVTGMACEQQ